MRERSLLKRLSALGAAQRVQQLASVSALQRALANEAVQSLGLEGAKGALSASISDWRDAISQERLTSELAPLFAGAARSRAEEVERREMSFGEAAKRTEVERTRHGAFLAQAAGIEAQRKAVKARLLRKSEEQALETFADLAQSSGERQ